MPLVELSITIEASMILANMQGSSMLYGIPDREIFRSPLAFGVAHYKSCPSR